MDSRMVDLPRSLEVYELALEGLCRVNEWLYRRFPRTSSIYSPGAGVRYRRETGEVWRHVGDVIAEGWGDCEDLAAARVGELRARKIDPKARLRVVRTGKKMTHAVVQRGNGIFEDPSKRLGMSSGKPSDVAPIATPNVAPADDAYDDEPYDDDEDFEEIGADPSDSPELSFLVEKTDKGYRGTVRIPLDLGRMLLVSRTAPKKEAASSKAVDAASSVLSNPVVSAMIPPQAKFALNLARSPVARNMAKKILKLF